MYNCTVGSWQLYRQTATAVYRRQINYLVTSLFFTLENFEKSGYEPYNLREL